ncbi:MAG TPA: hypothetical protein VGC36_13150, partial [Rhizomicrobium sp.]
MAWEFKTGAEAAFCRKNAPARRYRTALIFACAALFFASAATAAGAQSPNNADLPPAKPLLNPPQAGKSLSRDQVRGCMKQARDIGEYDKRMLEPTAKMEQAKQEIEAKSDALKTAQRTLNRSNRAAVNAFNKNVEEFNEAQKAFNLKVNIYNESRDEGRVLIHAYNMDC